VDTFRPNCDETGPAIGGSAGGNIYQHELATLKGTARAHGEN